MLVKGLEGERRLESWEPRELVSNGSNQYMTGKAFHVARHLSTLDSSPGLLYAERLFVSFLICPN